jgi:hypothetical protein
MVIKYCIVINILYCMFLLARLKVKKSIVLYGPNHVCGIEFLGYVMSVTIVRNLCYYFLIPELWPFQNSQQGCTAGQYLTSHLRLCCVGCVSPHVTGYQGYLLALASCAQP